MYRSTAAAASALSAALLATVLGLSLSSAPAAAYDDDVDVVGFDYEAPAAARPNARRSSN